MISEIEKQNFILNYYINKGELVLAEEIISKFPELSDSLRLIGIRYADFDDFEHALLFLEKAYSQGDNKSLPWLVELLKNGKNNTEQFELLQQKLDYLLKTDDMDVIFSLGNLYAIQEDKNKRYEIWKNYLNKNIWIFDRNIIGEILYSPIEESVLKYLNITGEDEYEIFNYVIKLLTYHSEKEAFAASMLLNSYLDFSNLPPYKRINKGYLMNRCDEYAKNGDIDSIFLLFRVSQDDPNFEQEQYLKTIKENNLEEIADLVGIDLSETTAASAPSFSNNMKALSTNKKQIDEIFEKAQLANQSGDFKAEIEAWVEGAKLGNRDCFYNIGVTVGNELGISCNFFGCSGGSENGWSVVAKGIQMNEIKPLEADINYISEQLGAGVISNYRKKYNLPDLDFVRQESNPPKEIIDKFLNYLEFSDFRSLKLASNLYCLPYIDNNQIILVFAEFVKNDDSYLLMIYASALKSKNKNIITEFEKNVLKILVRDAYIIFPNSGISLGNVFNNIPNDQTPNLFFNELDSREYWNMIGPTIDEMIIEPIPLPQEFTDLQFGVAIDLSLQSDHYETAISGAFKIVISVVSNLYALYEETKDKFDLFFDERSVYSLENIDFDISTPVYDHTAQKTLDQAIDKFVKNGEVDSYYQAKKDFGIFTNRLVSNAEMTEDNVDFIGTELLELSKSYDIDLDLRGQLNNVGWFFISKLQNFGKAFIYLEESARLGCANALSTATWHLMLEGKYQEAVDIFDKHYYKIMTTRDLELDFEQSANMRSNYAVCLWALGKDVSELNKIWKDKYFQGEHAESMFYPILIEYMNGNADKAISDLKALPGYVINQLNYQFSEDYSIYPWFKNIANKSVELLAKVN